MSHGLHDSTILVTGAAGRIGAVGRTVVELLRAEGLRVRAHVRVADERSEKLRALGAEIVVGDLLELADVHRAIEGCERVFFGMSVAPTYLEAAANVAAVARHHRVEAFVNLSQMTVGEMDIFRTTSSPQQKQHWLVEQILAWSGLPIVQIRPTAFMEGLFLQSARAVATEDRLLAPFGRGRTSPIAARDVARTVARILAEPAPHLGNTYELTGPIAQDMDGVARELSAGLGRPISYVDVPLAVWTDQLAALGLPAHVVAHLVTMAQLHQANRYDRSTTDVERLTGAPPMSVTEFVRRNAAAFARDT